MNHEICPRCKKSATTLSNRLIKENCGHVKCRECFINDSNGCLDCLTEEQTFQTQKPINSSHLPSTGFDQDSHNDLESTSGDLFIDTEVEDSIFEADLNAEDATESTSNVSTIHNYSLNGNQEAFVGESRENMKILEQYIIPPKLRIEQIFREVTAAAATQEDSQIKESAGGKEKTMPEHIISIEGADGSCYECSICKKKFRSWNQRYYHLHCGNEEGKPFKCKICSRGFSTSFHMNYHMETHTRKSKYPCNSCTKIFLNLSSLRRHMRAHDGVYKFKCEECGLAFREKASFVAHMNKHRNILPFSCKVCGKKFSFKSNLTQHQKMHSVDFQKGPIKHFRCDDCGKTFPRKNSYKEHIIRHSKVKRFTCQACQKAFIDRKTLERHMSTHGSAVYKCPRCDVKCVRKDNLVRHVRNMHTNENSSEILKSIKISIDSNNQCQESPASINSECVTKADVRLPEVSSIESQSHQIVISSSVIRSVGNVKPVCIPSTCDLDVNTVRNEVPPTQEQTDTVSNCNNSQSPQAIQSTENYKKPKKKYDPCEIYRKILFDNDADDSVLETEELCSDSKDDHVGCCNREPETVSGSAAKNVSTESFSFTEMHWRKRTSQSFYTA